MSNFYRWFIRDYSKLACPLNHLLKNDTKWEWSSECDKAFLEIKRQLVSAPILAYPDTNKEFILTTDTTITFSADMKDSEQCGIAASKGNQILGLIRRTIMYKEKQLIIPLYKAIVRPHLEYCIQAWRPHCKKDIYTLREYRGEQLKLFKN